MLSLADLNPGDEAVVLHLDDSCSEAGYLMEMGIIQGAVIRFIKKAPLGDPIELSIRGYHLSIRKAEAKGIFVERNHSVAV